MPNRAPLHKPASAFTDAQVKAQRERDHRLREKKTGGHFYNRSRWRKLRLTILREHPICETPGCGRAASHVDHRITRHERPDLAYEPTNLRALCVHCHSSKTASKDGGFGNPKRP